MRDGLRRNYDRAVDVLDRLVPIARALRGALLVYALLALAAVVAIMVLVYRRDAPEVWFTWGGFLLLAGVLALAPAVLLVFVWMLGEVLELPAKLRALPDVGPARAGELAELAREARRPDPPGERSRSVPGDLWRAVRLMLDLYGALPLPGPIAAILRWSLLVAVTVAAVAAFVEIVLALLLLAAAAVDAVL